VSAWLVALAACGGDGGPAGPPEDRPLADTLGGTLRVRSFLIAAGRTHRVVRDLRVEASDSIRIDGTLRIESGVRSVTLLASRALTVAGLIGPPEASSEATSASGPNVVAGGHASDVNLRGSPMDVLPGARIRGGNIRMAPRGSGPVTVWGGAQVVAESGRDATSSSENGEDGGSIEIGTGAAILATGGGIPTDIVIMGMLRAGDGGRGFIDLVGVAAANRIRVVTATSGGRGGDVRLSGSCIAISGGFVAAGGGGDAGRCGVLTMPVLGAPGATRGEPGEGIHCITGDGGAGGSSVIEGGNLTNSGTLSGGLGGLGPFVDIGAGNGGPGGAGGELVIRFRDPGAGGMPGSGGRRPGDIRVHGGGNGGDSDQPGLPGGKGGDITISHGDTVPIITGIPIALGSAGGRVSNGGLGFNGCKVQPFMAGTSGGSGGRLSTFGARFQHSQRRSMAPTADTATALAKGAQAAPMLRRARSSGVMEAMATIAIHVRQGPRP
jgi:hypothetical protein